MLMDVGCQGPGLACARALAVAGGQGTGGNGAEQGSRANVEREMEWAIETVFEGLGKPLCGFMICSLFRDLLA